MHQLYASENKGKEVLRNLLKVRQNSGGLTTESTSLPFTLQVLQLLQRKI